MSQSPVGQRLKVLIEALKMNPRSFSLKYGISEGTTRGYTDRGSIPNAEYIASILRSIENLNPTWLLLGEGEMFLEGSSPTQSTTITANKNKGNIQNNTGGHNKVTNHVTLEECRRDFEASQREVEQLKGQLTSKDAIIEAKDALIAAKEEMLVLLRGGHNRPN